MGKKLIIKVCGMKYPENREAVSALPIDIQGFIFYAPSKRDITCLEEEQKDQLFSTNKQKAGVFVNEDIKIIQSLISKHKLNYVQLHGNESPEDCKNLQDFGVKVIKAFRVDNTFDFGILDTYKNVTDLFLFDTKAELVGGTGKKFDWSILKEYKLDVPFLLSGGIGPEDAISIKELNHPMLHGVDLNSGFEDSPGKKNIEKLREFITQLKL